jgi:hypothetical protein
VLETLLALGVMALLGGSALVYTLLPWETTVTAGAWLIVIGLLEGVPTGFYYHVRLRQSLIQAGILPKRWWLHPTDHHGLLSPAERRRVLRWFALGGAGFVLAVLGCLLVALGAIHAQ